VIKMNTSDIAALRHPTSTEPDVNLTEDKSYAVVVSMAQCAENLRRAQERFIKMQLELSRLL